MFEPLCSLWLAYIREILGREIYAGGEGAAAKLASADSYGAEVEVIRSSCVSRVGIKGIIIKDSKFAFEIMTRKNTLKLVPKESPVFRLQVPAITKERGDQETEGAKQQQPLTKDFEIHGEQVQFRSADQATKKFQIALFEEALRPI